MTTAAAIGFRITADDQSAKTLDATGKRLKAIETQATTMSAELKDAAVTGLDKLTFGLMRGGVQAAKFGIGLGAVGVTAAAIGLGALAEKFSVAGASAGRSADMLGMPVEKMSQLQIAARLAGSSADDMNAGLTGLQQTMNAAAFGRDNQAFQVFKNAGIDAGNATTGVRKFSDVLPQIANEVQRLAKVNTDAALRFLDLTGIGRQLFPVFMKGSAGLKSWMDQANDFGPTTQKQREEARAFELTLTQLGLRFEQFGREAGASVVPALTKALGEFGAYLHDHKDDVAAFFTTVEHGLEAITKPENLKKLREGLDEVADGFNHIVSAAKTIERDGVIRWALGLTRDPDPPGSVRPSISSGIPMEDDGGKLERTLRKDNTEPSDRAKTAHDYFRKQGWSESQTDGILGYLRGESSESLDPAAFNPAGGNHGAQGIAQWRGARVDAFKQQYGHEQRDGTFQEQIEFIQYELTHGESAAAQKLKGTTNAKDAGAAVTESFGRPEADQLPGLRQQRGGYAEQYYQQFGGGAAPDASSTPAYTQAAPDAGQAMKKLQIDIRHVNPPPGAQMQIVQADPSQYDVTPKTVRSMPGAGTGGGFGGGYAP